MEQQSSKNKDWLITEKIVASLEKFITPESEVLHDGWLPVIRNEKRRKKQFDVVIKYGKEPRQHITVVEVQKRSRKVGWNTVVTWYAKMQLVGANQLICVSEKGYTSDVIDEVKTQYGNAVVLMTLKEFDVLTNPQKIDLDFNFALHNKHFEVIDVESPHVEELAKRHFQSGNITVNSSDRVFVIDDSGKRLNLKELAEVIVRDQSEDADYLEKQKMHKNHLIQIDIKPEANLFTYINNEKFKIIKWKFKIAINITDIQHEAKTKKFVYKHEIIGNELAWVATTTFKLQGKQIQLDCIAKIVNGNTEFIIKETVIMND